MTPDLRTRAAHLTAFIREYAGGRCRILSQGASCRCHLCTVDSLVSELAEAERRAFEAGFIAGRQPLTHPDLEPLIHETADAFYRAYQQSRPACEK